MTAETEGTKRTRIYQAGGSFYRGDTLNLAPRRKDLESETAIPNLILKGWMPEAPFIGPKSNIIAFGSCFASNIGKYMQNLGYDIATAREGKAYIQMIADGLVNVFAIAQQFEWAWENRTPTVELWHGWKAEEFGYDEEVRLATKELFDSADVFVLTFGLSEIWYDEPTGETFWRAVPENKFDKSRHKFRVATYAETAERLQRIYDLIRKHRPSATIIYTLSPIGLAATFRDVSCVAANAVSKALLRAGIDEVHRTASDPNFFYFPAYEIVLNAFKTPFVEDLRHPHFHVIDANMKAFERYFCTTGMTDADLQREIRAALDLDLAVTLGDRKDYQHVLTGLKDRWLTMGRAPTAVSNMKDKRTRAQEKHEERRQKIRDQRREAKRALDAGEATAG
ncbi:GSCFA domain-containing protein [Methylobacterium sp. WCS2018Hpa-22]|uniref:GSCFA domain-containing protein n=1 Tax=Methylobacterium sp. WCS2018Hpa-22 TaxID=3073633 RepID=UPI002889F2C2|nr:GSCFA domain-containing protein [Methylobacterium sp. WCS2018Hpa-22]